MLLKYRRPRSSEGTHRLGVTALLVALLLLGLSSAAHASSSLYWYGEGNSTCWQAGQPGGSSFACDSAGAGFLPSHMVEGGISADIFGVSASGDYCNYYRLGDHLTLEDSTNEGPTTGYTPPTPYGSYQRSDAYKNVCQAGGANWGQEVRRAAPENGCWTTCGMHHFVSFHSQGSNNRPWNSAFGAPTLIVSAEADPQLLSNSSEDAGAWGMSVLYFRTSQQAAYLSIVFKSGAPKLTPLNGVRRGLGVAQVQVVTLSTRSRAFSTQAPSM